MHSTIRRIAGTIAVAALALGAVAAASAHDASYPTTVTAHFFDEAAPDGAPTSKDPANCNNTASGDDDCFYGQVKSDLSACQRYRTVKVYGPEPPAPQKRAVADPAFPHLWGKTQSRRDGSWKLKVPNPEPGNYRAEVTRRTITRTGHTHVCGHAISDPVQVTGFG